MGRREPVAHLAPAGAWGTPSVFPPLPADPAGRPLSASLPSSLPGGAARAWAGKEGAGEGWGGGRKARGGGRRGRKRRAGRPAPGRGPAVWPGLVSPCLAPLQPPIQCGSTGAREPRYTGRSLPAGGTRLALIGAGGGGGGGSWRAARFPLETQSFCPGRRRRRRRGGLAAWGSRSGWEARGGLGPYPPLGPGVGARTGLGGVGPPPWGHLAPRHPACPRGAHPRLAPRPAFSPLRATSRSAERCPPRFRFLCSF